MIRIMLFFAFAVLLSASSVFSQTEVEIGKSAPNFTLKDVDGKVHNLNDFSGKYVVLEWINFDCPFVVKHYSGHNMQTLQKYYRDKGIVWLAICSSAPGKQGHFASKEIKKRIADNKAMMNAYLIDEDGKVGKLFDARTTPHMYVISPDGKLLYQGAIDDKKSTDKADIPNSKNYVREVLDNVLGGRDYPTTTTQPYGCSVKYAD